MKRWISLLLAAVMLFACIPMDAMATEEITNQVVSLSLETLPDKTKYLPGEELVLTGITAQATYSDGTVISLTADDLLAERVDLSESGNKIVTVSFAGQSASFEVHVHTVEILEAVAPTYTEPGLTEGKICGDPACGEILLAQEPVPVKAAPVLAAPVVEAEAAQTGVMLTWEAVEYAQSYRVYRKVADGEWTLLETVTDSCCLDTSAQSGVVLCYTVEACLQTAEGLVCSELAEAASVYFMMVTLKNETDGVAVEWPSLEQAAYYQVHRRIPGGSWETICEKTTETGYVDTAAESGCTYQYAVRAFADGEFTAYNYDLTFVRLEQPAMAVTNQPEGVQVSWSQVPGAEGYHVYRKVSGGWKLLSTETDTVYLDTTAESGTTYSYMVRAKNGEILSAGEKQDSVLRLAQPTVKLANIAEGISVKWEAVEGAESYRVYRKVSGGSWKRLKSGLTTFNYTDTTAEYGVTYYYSVRAYNNGVLSNYHLSEKILRLEQPEATVINKSNGIRITWNEVEDAEGYHVYRKVSGGSWKRLSTETDTVYLDTTAESGVKYTYRVRAKNGDTLSSNKHSVSILRLAQPTAKPTNIAEGISVKWDAIKGAQSYRVYRKVPGGSWKTVADKVTDTVYVDTTVQFGVTYCYAVSACSGTTRSTYRTSGEYIRIEQPKLTVSNYSTGIITSWNEVEAAESYNLYRKVSGGSWKLLSNVTGTSYLDKTAEDGVTYSYRIRAKNGEVLSSNKRSVSILRLAKADVTVSNVYTGVSVKWSQVEGAESYRVYRKVPGGSWKTLKTDLTALSYTDTTAQNATTYQYAVRSYNSTGSSAYASSIQIIRLEQPEATASNKANGIRITWNEVEGAESYRVYRKVSGGSWKRLSTETGTSYLDTTAESGVKYSYRVRAKNGDVLSSNKLSISILRLSRPIATAGNGNTGVLIRWEAIEGAESYRILRKVPDGSWKTIASNVTELKYTDTTAKSGMTYYYAVRAYGDGVLSSYTATEAVQYLSRPVVTAKTVSTTSVKLQWNAVEGAQKYTLYVKTADTDWAKLYTGTRTSYTAKNLTFGETYSFGVRAVKDSVRSSRSATVKGKATYPAPDYTLELKPGEGILVSWTAVDGAGSYRVYRREEGGSWKTLKTTTSTSYVDTSGKCGMTYEYAVRAFELAKAGGISGIRATGQKIVYSKIDPDKPMLALTFDDGPSGYTEDILDQLERYDARATFFVVGERVSDYASTIQRAHSLGCEIGNHSWSHPDLSSISISAMQNEISRTDAAIEKITGEVPALLRPPYGGIDADVRYYAGKPLIHWSVDTRDWATQSSSSTIYSVLNNARDGSIVLMHDIYSATRNAAVSLIPSLISSGYQLVTVSEMAAYRGITLEDGTVYYRIP